MPQPYSQSSIDHYVSHAFMDSEGTGEMWDSVNEGIARDGTINADTTRIREWNARMSRAIARMPGWAQVLAIETGVQMRQFSSAEAVGRYADSHGIGNRPSEGLAVVGSNSVLWNGNSADNTFRIFTHELGHRLDHNVGMASGMGRYISQNDGWWRAVEADRTLMQSRGHTPLYDLEVRTVWDRIHNEPRQTAAIEAFAEMFSHHLTMEATGLTEAEINARMVRTYPNMWEAYNHGFIPAATREAERLITRRASITEGYLRAEHALADARGETWTPEREIALRAEAELHNGDTIENMRLAAREREGMIRSPGLRPVDRGTGRGPQVPNGEGFASFNATTLTETSAAAAVGALTAAPNEGIPTPRTMMPGVRGGQRQYSQWRVPEDPFRLNQVLGEEARGVQLDISTNGQLGSAGEYIARFDKVPPSRMGALSEMLGQRGFTVEAGANGRLAATIPTTHLDTVRDLYRESGRFGMQTSTAKHSPLIDEPAGPRLQPSAAEAPVAPAPMSANDVAGIPHLRSVPLVEAATVATTAGLLNTGSASGVRAGLLDQAAGRGAGMALGGYMLYQQLGPNGTLARDQYVGGAQGTTATASTATIAAAVAIDTTAVASHGANLIAAGSRGATLLEGASSGAGRLFLPLAVLGTTLQTASSLEGEDGRGAVAAAAGGTAGILAGVWAGAAIGGAAGTIVPGFGNVIGAVGGAVVGLGVGVAAAWTAKHALGDSAQAGLDRSAANEREAWRNQLANLVHLREQGVALNAEQQHQLDTIAGNIQQGLRRDYTRALPMSDTDAIHRRDAAINSERSMLEVASALRGTHYEQPARPAQLPVEDDRHDNQLWHTVTRAAYNTPLLMGIPGTSIHDIVTAPQHAVQAYRAARALTHETHVALDHGIHQAETAVHQAHVAIDHGIHQAGAAVHQAQREVDHALQGHPWISGALSAVTFGAFGHMDTPPAPAARPAPAPARTTQR